MGLKIIKRGWKISDVWAINQMKSSKNWPNNSDIDYFDRPATDYESIHWNMSLFAYNYEYLALWGAKVEEATSQIDKVIQLKPLTAPRAFLVSFASHKKLILY